MTDPVEAEGAALPPPTEEIHMPEPSYLPAVLAFGVTLALVGVIFSIIVVALGAIIFVVALYRWIAQTRAEMAELPLEHQ